MLSKNPLALIDLMPDTVAEWHADTTVVLASTSDMYTYMDGGAELYISYGFGEALSRTYTREGQPPVLAEVYDLLNPENAFGVFTQTREDENRQYGQGTYSIPGAVFFWKNRYYISLSCWDSTPEALGFIDALALHIDSMIPETGSIPDVVKCLPEEGLIPNGYKYFHHPVWLNAYFFISDHNPLLIDNNAGAILARYADGDKRIYLLVVKYADKQASGKAFENFKQEFFPDGLTDSCILLENKTWMAAAISGQMVAAAFNGISPESVRSLLLKTLQKSTTLNGT